ncbi:TPA: ribonuclease HII [Candidatus Veblenbacteria bacterium]|nr:ribonuclease HII [Candidatus Veblenbacteria bacterium]
MKPNLRQENKLWRLGFRTVVGVDEVGRGAWAGPLVAAAVVMLIKFKKKPWHKLVNDSKKLSPQLRQKIFDLAINEVDWATGLVTSQTIDKIGVAEANKLAVKLAIKNLKKTPDFILMDFIARFSTSISGKPTKVIIKGDAKVFSIALASVIAKVSRDQLMIKYETKYPGYGFAQHKGYGTRQHLLALKKLGPCPIHRRTYRPLRRVLL